MLNTLFQVSETIGSEEDFFNVVHLFYDLNLGLSGAGPFCIPRPPFERIW